MSSDNIKPGVIFRDTTRVASALVELLKATNSPYDRLAIGAYFYANVLGAADAAGCSEQELERLEATFRTIAAEERLKTANEASEETKQQWKVDLEASRRQIN